MRRLLWILLAILIAVLFALVVQQGGTLAGLSQYDFSSLTTKLVALVFVCVLVLALFRQRFSHALESALIWVLIALLLAIGYTYRFELRDVAERVLAEFIPGRGKIELKQRAQTLGGGDVDVAVMILHRAPDHRGQGRGDNEPLQHRHAQDRRRDRRRRMALAGMMVLVRGMDVRGHG